MEIFWLGRTCFLLKGTNLAVVTDPINDTQDYRSDLPSANVFTLSHLPNRDERFDQFRADRRVLRGPGEYEVSGVFFTGIKTFPVAGEGAAKGLNTAYRFKLDGVQICHLGALGHVPTSDHVSAIGDVDLLFIPLEGETLTPSAAAETVGLLEPRVIVPMPLGKGSAGETQDVIAVFLRELGLPAVDPIPHCTVTTATLRDEPQVVLLEPPD